MQDEEDVFFEPEPVDGEVRAGAMDQERVALAMRLLRQVQDVLHNVVELLDQGDVQTGRRALVELLADRGEHEQTLERLQADRVVEGVFDGEQMIGSDGKTYAVSANYASKSRLVEGDILKLTIRGDGAFVYKQIGPTERRRVEARLAWDASSGSYVAIDPEQDRVWKVLNASVSFYRGQEGDRVFLFVPKGAPSTWAAIDSVIRE